MEKWNNRYVSSPPAYFYSKQDHKVKRDIISRMYSCVSELGVQLSNQTVLEGENFYLKRIIYKLKNQQRREKTFAYLQLINKCVQRFLDVNLSSIMTGLSTDLQRIISETPDNLNYLPSQQTLQYHLVKLMGGAGLLAQIMIYCSQVVIPVRQQMNQHHFVDKNLLFLGIVSRIWVTSTVLLGLLQNCYDRMFPLMLKFPANQLPWLTKDEDLPSNLGEWLSSNWPSLHVTSQKNIDMEKDEENQTEVKLTPLINESSVFNREEDIGVPFENHKSTLMKVDRNKIQLATIKMRFAWIKNTIRACTTSKRLISVIERVRMAFKLWPKSKIPTKFRNSLKQNLLKVQSFTGNEKAGSLRSVIKNTLKTIISLSSLGVPRLKLSGNKTTSIFYLLDMSVTNKKMLRVNITSIKRKKLLRLGPVLVKLTKKQVQTVDTHLKKSDHSSLQEKINSFKCEIMSAIEQSLGFQFSPSSENGAEHAVERTFHSTINSSSTAIDYDFSGETQDLEVSKNGVKSSENCTTSEEDSLLNNTNERTMQTTNVKKAKKKCKKRKRETNNISKPKKGHSDKHKISKVAVQQKSKSKQKLKKCLSGHGSKRKC